MVTATPRLRGTPERASARRPAPGVGCPEMEAKGRRTGILGVAVRDATRLQQIASILGKHGFGEVLTVLPFFRHRVDPAEPGAAPPEGTQGERFARVLAELGPTYIKLGQILSMRPDLLPADYIKALTALQDQAPLVALADVLATIERGLGKPVGEIFERFDDKPIATASIAQAHRARTRDGREVVVKVQRPGIEETMRGDLDLLYLGARALEAGFEDLQLIAPSRIVAEFEKAILRELNFALELQNILVKKSLLDPARPVCVPEPVPALCCRTVLTTELFDGVPVRDLEPDTPRTRAIVEHIVHTMAKDVLVDGVFHGDPHAGNILISPEGRICFLDLGMVGTLSPEQREDMVTFVLAVLVGDSGTAARIALRMGTPMRRVNIAELKAEISRVRSQYISVRALADVDSAAFVEELSRSAARFRIRLATEHSVLAKSIATIEGLVRRLHPGADLIEIVRPIVEGVFGERMAPLQVLQHALGGVTGVTSLARAIPNHLDQILHDLETGNVQVRPVMPVLDELPARVHESATRIGVAIFAAAMSVCAALVVPDDFTHWMSYVKALLFLTFFVSAIAGWFVHWWWHWLGGGFSLPLSPVLNLLRRR